MRIEALFPLPLGVFDYPDAEAARDKVAAWLNAAERRYIQNEGNLTLEGFALHREPCMAELTRFFESAVRVFLDAIGHDVPDFAITQCWLNINRPGERHHRHHHPNNFVSGVYYLDAIPQSGSIAIHRPGLAELQPGRLKATPFTFDLWNEEARTGKLVLFPSRLEHSVEPNRSGQNRLSISFNVMFRGLIGSHLQQVEFG
ncbi:MAG: hypothetical protein HYR63_23635 [Proteobacteria bacterium]|nr:hypothetical protein [Pseudomonadota bacterium]